MAAPHSKTGRAAQVCRPYSVWGKVGERKPKEKRRSGPQAAPPLNVRIPGRGSALLKDGGNTHAAANTQSGQTLLCVVTLGQLVEQGDDDTSA